MFRKSISQFAGVSVCKAIYFSFFIFLFSFIFVSCRSEEEPIIDPDPAPAVDSVNYFAYGLADIDITTDGKVDVDSKDPADYRPCTITVAGGEVFDDYEGRGQIRGRGNSTWEWYPKKPYRIKLDEPSPMLGMAKNRDWVLLADYRDVTHMMNNVGFTLAHVLGLPYTNHSRYAKVTLNGKKLGLYMVTEQVEQGANRVNIDKDGGLLLALDINDGPAHGNEQLLFRCHPHGRGREVARGPRRHSAGVGARRVRPAGAGHRQPRLPARQPAHGCRVHD